MRIESEAGVVHYPSPKQAAEIARGLGHDSGRAVALVVGEAAVVAQLDGRGRHVLEYVQRDDPSPYQALSVSLDVVVDAFERFAAGDETRSPEIRWSRVDTRLLSSIASGGQRLPESFYEIAPRLRAGARPLDLRNEIIAATGLSKLAAAKRVEEVHKILRAARTAVGGGLLISGWLAFTTVTSGWTWFGSLLWGAIALAQFGFAGYIFRESRPRS